MYLVQFSKFKRRDQLRFVSGVWDVGPTFTPVDDIIAYRCGFSSRIIYLIWGSMLWGQHLILNPNIGLLCWLENNGPEDLDNKLKLPERAHNIKITRPNSRPSDKYACPIFIEFLASNFGQGETFLNFLRCFLQSLQKGTHQCLKLDSDHFLSLF
jgi:hypothetical protein